MGCSRRLPWVVVYIVIQPTILVYHHFGQDYRYIDRVNDYYIGREFRPRPPTGVNFIASANKDRLMTFLQEEIERCYCKEMRIMWN